MLDIRTGQGAGGAVAEWPEPVEFPGPPTREACGAEIWPSHADVARRAFEIYRSRGGGLSTDYQATEDWLRAEQELSTASPYDPDPAR